jgi:hypothetical protein
MMGDMMGALPMDPNAEVPTGNATQTKMPKGGEI